jgi:dipeptide/tripeptide permease
MKVLKLFQNNDTVHYVPIIWLAVSDQLIVLSKFNQTRNKTLPTSTRYQYLLLFYLVAIIFLNTFVYKRLEASGRSISIRTRIVIGMISAVVAMCMAGTVEIFRQYICTTQNFTQTIGIYFHTLVLNVIYFYTIGDKTYLAANMSVFFQFPQYVGIGLAEVFTSVASLEFAYLAAPRSAQSLIMSLRVCSAGLSSFAGWAIVGLLSINVRYCL